MAGYIPTEATLTVKQRRIWELLEVLCPDIDADSPIDDRKVAWWELEALMDGLVDAAKEIAVRRQGKIIMAAIRGDLIWPKGDDEGYWHGRGEVDSEEDTLDALEEMMNPDRPANYMEAMERMLREEGE